MGELQVVNSSKKMRRLFKLHPTSPTLVDQVNISGVSWATAN